MKKQKTNSTYGNLLGGIGSVAGKGMKGGGQEYRLQLRRVPKQIGGNEVLKKYKYKGYLIQLIRFSNGDYFAAYGKNNIQMATRKTKEEIQELVDSVIKAEKDAEKRQKKADCLVSELISTARTLVG